MRLSNKYINWTNYILSGVGIIILGIIIIVGSSGLYKNTIELLVFVFLLSGLSKLLSAFLKKKQKHRFENIIRAGLSIGLALIMTIFPNVPISLLPILFAIYLIFNGLVKLLEYWFLRENKQSGRLVSLFLSTFFLITGGIFLFSPLGHLPTILGIMGGYCILFGLEEIKELLIEIVSPTTKDKIKRQVRVSLPTFFDAFIPRKFLTEINHYFNTSTNKEQIVYIDKKEDRDIDLEIFIHVAPSGFNQFGHMDIYFDNQIISYGNYDESSMRIFDSTGDGVFFSIDSKSAKDDYISFCISHSNKTLIGFGLKLTTKQKEQIRAELQEIMAITVEWEPEAVRDFKTGAFIPDKVYKDYASNLYLATKAKFYKFTTGKFKTYFVMGTNCTLFADTIVGKTGTDILKMVGIITPGTYLDYLEDQLKKTNSMVISKTIYNKETKNQIVKTKTNKLKKKSRKGLSS
ncbi:MAG: DUF308 domain-containing protein [Bacilli bacterium]